MASDLVYDSNGHAVWCDSSEGVREWLQYRLRAGPKAVEGLTIRIGWPEEYLTVDQYLERGTK